MFVFLKTFARIFVHRFTAINKKNMKSSSFNRSEIMSMAWSIKKQNQFLTFSQSLVQAWKVAKLKKALAAGEAKFTFQKTNGEVREAIGTTKAGAFQYEYKGTERTESPNQIKYFDLEKSAWRSFRAERILSVAA